MVDYCILPKIEMDESNEDLNESDVVIVEEFNRILSFYNQEKNQVSDKDCFMDIFSFFTGRYMILEATIQAEKELGSVTHEEEAEKDNTIGNEGNEDTAVIDRMVEELGKSFQVQKSFIWIAI